MINPEDPNVRTAVFGVQVQNFMDSEIGAYIMNRADEYAQEAMEELTKVDPEDPRAIRSLQNRIHVADLIATWLREAVSLGEQAQEHLKYERQ